MDLLHIETTPGAFPVSLLYRKADGGLHRRTMTPDDDLSELPAAALAEIEGHWAALDAAEWERLVRPALSPPTALDVKAEAGRRILQIAPDWKQRNLTARGVELVLALVKNKPWTAEEAAEAQAIQAVWDRIKAVRAASDGLEAALPQDFADDRHWP
jgi:hypothetical protein